MILFLRNFFGFNRQQRNGLILLLILSFILLIARLTLPYLIPPSRIQVQTLSPEKLKTVNPAENGLQNREPLQSLFSFDPNNVTAAQLQQLGFSAKCAGTLIRYRSKGRQFRKKEDLKKVFGVSDALYNSIAPYIVFEQNNPRKSERRIFGASRRQTPQIELNGADSASLVSLRGIGPAFARRILKYRSALGGFVNIAQLKEVYGFTEEMFRSVASGVRTDATAIRKIRINDDDFRTINRHPYISYELCVSIVNARRKARIDEAQLTVLLGDSLLVRRLRPYVALD